MTSVVAQQVSGTVVDNTQEPLIGVNVKVKGASVGVVTDLDGKYLINDAGGKNAVLVFSYVGFKPQEVAVNGRSVINVTLVEDTEMLDEVVVVGFQTQRKVNVGGAISSVGQEAFENRPVANIGQALQGVVPNLNISIGNGKPNEVPSFNIRGTASIDLDPNDKTKYETKEKAPLILVDGVDVSTETLNQLNPNDVENMSVIKDASAAAIYGTKATYGVILITTKSGKFNQKSRISYSYDLSFDSPSAVPDIMNAYEIQNFVIKNSEWTLKTPSDLDKRKLAAIEAYMADPTNPANRYIMNGNSIVWTGNMNPYDLVLRNYTPTHKHNLSISGGGDRISYFLSLGYHDEEGMYKIGTDYYKRYNFSTRFNAKVTDWFNLETKISYNRNSYDEAYVPACKGSIWSVLKQDADKNIMMPIKSLPTDPTPDKYTDNYLAWLDYGNRTNSQRWTTLMSLSTEFILIKNMLKLKGDFALTPSGYDLKRNAPRHEYLTFTWNPVSEVAESVYNGGRLEKSNTDDYQINVYADFNKTFAKRHSLSAIIGFNQELRTYSQTVLGLKYLIIPIF